MSEHAAGRFDVVLTPGEPFGDGMTRLSVTKNFHGDLEGSGAGEMLAFRSGVSGSAGYVLIERLTVSLRGKTGAFVLQHFGLMARGEPEARITVVPDSGAGDLEGITGEMSIDPAAHGYSFKYDLSEAR